MKKFWKYLTLTILLLLGLCCVGILYLFFVPGSSLFGICYVSFNEKFSSEDFNTKNIETIVLNSNKYDVTVISTEDDDISLNIYNNSLGFVLTKNKTTSISSQINNSTLSLVVTETTGFAIKNSSYIELLIPEDKTFNLKLINKKAETEINGSDLNINNLTYQTNSGDCIVTNANITGKLNLNLNKSTFKVSSDVQTSANDVELNLTTGKFDASESTFNNITIETNTRGIVDIKECANLTQNITSAGGRIEAETVSMATITSSSTNVYINTISNGAKIILTGTGNVEIDSLTGDGSSILTDSGNINIKNANSYTKLSSTDGDITISKAMDHIDVKTNYGTINVKFNKDAVNKYLSATLEDGKLIASGLEKVNLMVEDNGRAELEMSDVVGTSYVQGKTGSIFIKVNKLSKYKLSTASEGDVRVNLAQIPQYGGYTDKTLDEPIYVNCTASEHQANYNDNVLEVSTTTGILTILDSNFA